MERISFAVPDDALDEVLDAIMPLLPGGARISTGSVTALGHGLPGRAELEAAAGRPLAGWSAGPAPADWRLREQEERARVEVGGRLVVRDPQAPPAPDGVLDVVIERDGPSFGAGSHPTTRMCLELLLGLEPSGDLADLGCGLGTLAIVAGRLGWSPVAAVDRDPAAIAMARRNARRNGVDVRFAEADLAASDPRLAACVLVNAPRDVHMRVARALTPEVRCVVISSLLPDELDEVLIAYAGAGLATAARLEDDGWTAALLARPGVGWSPVEAGERGDAAAAAEAERAAREPDPPIAELLDPGRIAAAGAAFGQAATSVDTGGVILSCARLVEQGARATLALVPGLFRFDMTPSGESLGVAFRPLARAPMRWRAEHETLDGFRRDEGEPLVFHGEFDHAQGRLVAMVQVLSLSDHDLNALHLIAKSAVHPA